MGFGVPIADGSAAPLGDQFEQLVLAPDALSRDQLDVTAAAVAPPASTGPGQVDHDHRLWVLLMFELWARTWLKHAAAVV